ncbi:MAG TPA: branched-chain amino acid ABC transporter permease [Bellilinea sp.]|nr:branched-chain amino acid ABC transporter permease [Bellilinea sp.]
MRQLFSLGKHHLVTKILLLGLFIAVLIIPLFVKLPFPLHVFIAIFMFITLSESWNILGGFAGQASIMHAVYFGLGAYGSTMMQLELGVNPWIAFIIGPLVTIPVSYMVGIPTFKLAGHFFVIATLAVGEVVRILFQNWEYVGGNVGLTIPVKPEGIVNFQFHSSKAGYYYISLAMAILTVLVVFMINKSKIGYYLKAVRGDQDAAAAIGINPQKYKLQANAISALIAGVAGAFYSQYVLFIDPVSVMSAHISILVMLITVLGGMGTVMGPVVGSLILIPLSELTRVYWGGTGNGFDQIIYGLLIVLFAVFQPYGLMGLFSKRRKPKVVKS